MPRPLTYAEAKANWDRMYEWREWFGFRPGWPARRAARLARVMHPLAPPVETDGHTFEPVSDGWAVGFKITHRTGKVSYLYLNPSDTLDEDPNVFLYLGTTGNPAIDPTVLYVDVEENTP